jgi:hypothetical protein
MNNGSSWLASNGFRWRSDSKWGKPVERGKIMFIGQCIAILVALILLIGCTSSVCWGLGVQGSGKMVTENRALESFEKLQVDISADVSIKQGQAVKCSISGDDNIVSLIQTDVAGQQLRIGAKETISPKLNIKIEIEVPLLTEVVLNGSGNIWMDQVTRDKAYLALKGSGSITANGSVKELTAALEGSGKLQLDKLSAGQTTVKISGSGDAFVCASESLTSLIKGSGNLTAMGKARIFDAAIYGSGSIKGKELKTTRTAVSIFGSGNVEVSASEAVVAKIFGSGSVYYWGNPVKVDKTIMGSGTIAKQ